MACRGCGKRIKQAAKQFEQILKSAPAAGTSTEESTQEPSIPEDPPPVPEAVHTE